MSRTGKYGSCSQPRRKQKPARFHSDLKVRIINNRKIHLQSLHLQSFRLSWFRICYQNLISEKINYTIHTYLQPVWLLRKSLKRRLSEKALYCKLFVLQPQCLTRRRFEKRQSMTTRCLFFCHWWTYKFFCLRNPDISSRNSPSGNLRSVLSCLDQADSSLSISLSSKKNCCYKRSSFYILLLQS